MPDNPTTPQDLRRILRVRQSIATAPRDGTWILAYCHGLPRPIKTRWRDDHWHAPRHHEVFPYAWSPLREESDDAADEQMTRPDIRVVLHDTHSLLAQGPMGLEFRIKNGVAHVAVTGAREFIPVPDGHGIRMTVELIDIAGATVSVKVERQ